MNVQIVCVFSFWQIESTLCLFIDWFTYYDLVKYTLIQIKWSLPLIWCSEAVTLLFTSQKWGSRRRRAAPVWILLLFCQQIHKKYGRWVCVYQKRSRAVQRPLIVACYHSVLEMSHCGSDDSWRLKWGGIMHRHNYMLPRCSVRLWFVQGILQLLRCWDNLII